MSLSISILMSSKLSLILSLSPIAMIAGWGNDWWSIFSLLLWHCITTDLLLLTMLLLMVSLTAVLFSWDPSQQMMFIILKKKLILFSFTDPNKIILCDFYIVTLHWARLIKRVFWLTLLIEKLTKVINDKRVTEACRTSFVVPFLGKYWSEI